MKFGNSSLRQVVTALPLNYLHVHSYLYASKTRPLTRCQCHSYQIAEYSVHQDAARKPRCFQAKNGYVQAPVIMNPVDIISVKKNLAADKLDGVRRKLLNQHCVYPLASQSIVQATCLEKKSCFLPWELCDEDFCHRWSTTAHVPQVASGEDSLLKAKGNPSYLKTTFSEDLNFVSLAPFESSLFITAYQCNKSIKRVFEQDQWFSAISPSHASSDKQPADHPSQKLHLLYEKMRNEIPMFFNEKGPWHDFSVYTSDIQLALNVTEQTHVLRGIKRYKGILSLFRRACKVYLCHANMEVLNISANEEHNTIEVRWRVTGWPPMALLVTVVFRMPTSQRYYDFMSTFYVNKDGQVWRHDVSKVQRLSDPSPAESPLDVFKARRSLRSAATLASRSSSISSWFEKYLLYFKQNPS